MTGNRRPVMATRGPDSDQFLRYQPRNVEESIMYQMVVLVLDDLDKSAAILEAWERAGVSGVTILESTGLGRLHRNLGAMDDLPLMPSLQRMLRTREEQHRTIFTLVEGDTLVDTLIRATEEITGDLNEANRGIIFVLPVMRVIGIANGLKDKYQ